MDNTFEQLELLWNDLLSRQTELIQQAFKSLDIPSQKMVIDHLQKMVNESGWQPEQRVSAKAALNALENHMNQDIYI
jgi:hypothetical protein